MGAIYLIRHGQASFGQKNYDKLSDKGRQQAMRLGDYLRESAIAFDHIFSGSLERQIDTAQLALGPSATAADLMLTQHPGFNEFDHEAVTRHHVIALAENDPLVADFMANRIDRMQHFQQVFEKVIERWISEQYPITGIESWSEFRERVWGGLQEVLSQVGRGKDIAIFTSGGPITAILNQVLRISPESAFEMNWAITNASITKLFYNERKISLSYFNHYSYLKQGPDRSLITYL